MRIFRAGTTRADLLSKFEWRVAPPAPYDSYFFTGFPAVFLGADGGLTLAFMTVLAAALLTGFALAGAVLVTALATVFVVALGFDLVAVAGLSLAFFDAAGFLLLSALLVALATLWAMPGSLSNALLTACLN